MRWFHLMTVLCVFAMSTACATPPRNLFRLGETDLSIKTSAYPEFTADDWSSITATSCITHLYRCNFDESGQVTQFEPMDLSAPNFKALSDEAIRSWKFMSGKSGQCFVDFIYSADGGTRIVIVPESMAKEIAARRARLRTVDDPAKPKVKSIATVLPRYPFEALKKGQSGVVTVRFDVSPEGRPENTRIERSEPENVFDRATLQAHKRWRYPTLEQEPNKVRKGLTASVYFKPTGTFGYECELGY
ncbi:MAG TPA: energy transducer TonB [Oligoflexus sp.]|uniref:energy transducer TonB n=1 Tax=Oligoflexus sp. TaxID=1971216 RepID=UPI002D603CDB|nr:energy transducer TonB [Oligoflexus sp.]HYX32678.1 energy transducer TonB [Oligoflexus sp.]